MANNSKYLNLIGVGLYQGLGWTESIYMHVRASDPIVRASYYSNDAFNENMIYDTQYKFIMERLG